MSGTGRNDPCPCGSGRKYKQCCLRRDEAVAAVARERDRALQSALDWVDARHPEVCEAAIVRGYFGSLGERERAEVADLDAPAHAAIDRNAGEWLLADATLDLEVEGARTAQRIADLVLGAGGPALIPAHRALIASMRDRPLRLYEVIASRPGEGLTLRDALDGADTVEVPSAALADWFVPGEYAGLRLIDVDGAPGVSAAVYGFSAGAGPEVVVCLGQALEEETGDDGARRRVVTETIVDAWLAGMIGGRSEGAPGDADAAPDGASS